jgi:hypothetical protein
MAVTPLQALQAANRGAAAATATSAGGAIAGTLLIASATGVLGEALKRGLAAWLLPGATGPAAMPGAAAVVLP